MNENLSVAEQMALAVLKGDLHAAMALADHLLNEIQTGSTPVEPTRKLTVDRKRIRVAVFFPPDTTIDYGTIEQAVDGWLNDYGGPLVLTGAERIEVYELPEPPEPVAVAPTWQGSTVTTPPTLTSPYGPKFEEAEVKVEGPYDPDAISQRLERAVQRRFLEGDPE